MKRTEISRITDELEDLLMRSRNVPEIKESNTGSKENTEGTMREKRPERNPEERGQAPAAGEKRERKEPQAGPAQEPRTGPQPMVRPGPRPEPPAEPEPRDQAGPRPEPQAHPQDMEKPETVFVPKWDERLYEPVEFSGGGTARAHSRDPAGQVPDHTRPQSPACRTVDLKMPGNPAHPAGTTREGSRHSRRVRTADFHGSTARECSTWRVHPSGFLRPCDGLIAAFFVPVILMVIIFVQRGIFPFGEESFLRTDMYHQYAPFFSEFQHKLKTGQSLLYSWDVGMGVNFSALYAYYLASPVNWLLVLCPDSLTLEFMTYMIVIKIGLCGLSMAWYLRRHCSTQDFGVAFFGIFYALSGYMAAYSWNIMWLDCILLFPVIVYGLERLVQDGKGMTYGLALGLSILSNYYISIMTCIFMVFYFAALVVMEDWKGWKKLAVRWAQFAGYSLLAGGISAVVLVPAVYALRMTASGDFNFPKTFTQYFSIFDMIARHIGNVETEIGLDHWPNVYCGVAVLMFVLLYLMCRKVPAKEKAVYGILILFFFASFSMNVLNFIWHGFHYPNSLPCRQSYIYIFLVLLVCYRAYVYLPGTPRKHVLTAFWGAVAFVLMAQKLVTEDHFKHFIIFYVAILFLTLYLGMIYLYRKGPRFHSCALLCTLALVALEAGANTAVTSVTTTSRTAYKRDNQAVERLVDHVLPGGTFFRMEKVTRKTKNDGAWLHFPSVSLFSSTASADLTKLFKKLGCESSTNAYSITGATPLVDMLMAVKYGIYSEEQAETDLHSLVKEEHGTWLYENTSVLPLGFVVSTNFDNEWDLEAGNPVEVQNSLAASAGAGPVLETVLDTTVEGKTQSFYPETSGEYFAYVSNKKIEKVKVTTKRGTQTFNNIDRGYLLELGYCEEGYEVTLTAEDTSEEMWADIYRFSEENLKTVCAYYSREPWNLTRWTETSLEGKVACQDYSLLMTTVPYDRGWRILVDGQEQGAQKVMGAFVGVRLEPGRHTVYLSYMPEGLKSGALLTLGSVLVLAGIAVGRRFLDRRRLPANHH